MVGVRFRPQGKDPVTGLDCVGLVWAAYAAAGRRLVRPANYPLRGWGLERIEGALAVADFVRADDAMRAGDVALIGHPAGQYHLGLIGQETFIRSEEHTSELQSLMRISYAVFCLKKKKPKETQSQ